MIENLTPAVTLEGRPETDTHAAVLAYYRWQARIYDATRWLFLYDRHRAVQALRLSAGQTVLEVGCGTGMNLMLLRQAVGSTGTVIGADISEEMLARAQHKVRRHRWSNVRLVQADAARLQPDQTCHAVLFAYSLSMIPNWQQALTRGIAHLLPGGRLVLLDFGTFAGWGRRGQQIAAWWLRKNHVETQRHYRQVLRQCLDELEFESPRGGYNFLAVGRRPDRDHCGVC